MNQAKLEKIADNHFQKHCLRNSKDKSYIIAHCDEGVLEIEVDSSDFKDFQQEAKFIGSVFGAYNVQAYTFLSKSLRGENTLVKAIGISCDRIVVNEYLIEGDSKINNTICEEAKELPLVSGFVFDKDSMRFMQKRLKQEGFSAKFL